MSKRRKELRKSFVECPCFGFSSRASGTWHRMITDWNALHIRRLPTFFVHPHQRQTMGDTPITSRSAVFGTARSVWLVHTCVNFMRQRQSHCSQAGQLNDLLSKGYSTCAFLSTNQAHAMPSNSSNNLNGNLVLNSISDTTILLMQNSDRFGWQGRNACF